MVKNKAIRIEVLGIDEVTRLLKDKNKEALANAQTAIKKATIFLEAEVKASVAGRRAEIRSVDTSRFLNSISSESTGLDGSVYSNVEHAAFLEFGTSKLKERRHFRNSKARNEDKIKKFVEDEIAKISN